MTKQKYKKMTNGFFGVKYSKVKMKTNISNTFSEMLWSYPIYQCPANIALNSLYHNRWTQNLRSAFGGCRELN